MRSLVSFAGPAVTRQVVSFLLVRINSMSVSSRCWLLLISILWPTIVAAQSAVPELTEDTRRAVDSIRQSSVLSTVAFLASDEMAGRQTPSPELNIASRFVASRFRGAELESLDEGATFFETSNFEVSQPPLDDVALAIVGADPLRCRGILCATSERLQITAAVIKESELADAESPRIVVIDEVTIPPQAVDKPSSVLLTLRRRLRKVKKTGVQLVLMKCAAESPLIEVARRLAKNPSPLRPGLQPDCAVVLVPETAALGDVEVTAEIGAQQITQVPVRNVLGVLRGSDQALRDQAIIVSAHLDHIGISNRGTDRIYNGADDNASGVTAVLELAAAFSLLKDRPRRSIVFCTFWGEEKGLLGSKSLVQTPPWPLKKVTANINLEMVGRPESDAREKIWMTGWKHSNLGSLMNTGSQRIGVAVFDRKDVGEMLYTRSDNYSFVKQGVIAHSFSAGSLHSDYHQPGDEWQKLDIPHMTKVIQGLFCGILHVANQDAEPQKTK